MDINKNVVSILALFLPSVPFLEPDFVSYEVSPLLECIAFPLGSVSTAATLP